MTEFEQVTAEPADRASVVDSARAESAGPTLDGANLLRLQSVAGNRAVAGLIAQRQAQQQDGPYATKEEADDVVTLMPVMGDIDTLCAATEAECAKWNQWRGTLQGDIPGNHAFVAMTQFMAAVRAKGLDPMHRGIQAILRRRLSGDNHQLLTEMCSFSIGAGTAAGGDPAALALAFGAPARPLRHRYHLKVYGSISPKQWYGESGSRKPETLGPDDPGSRGVDIGVSFSYTAKLAVVSYSNDFGMKYSMPVQMDSLGAGIGAGLGGSQLGYGTDSEGSDESLMFWKPEDFGTDFQVIRAAVNVAIIGKASLKAIDVVRVASDKHPALVFNMMAGTPIAPSFAGAEAGASAGESIDQQLGLMTPTGPVSVTAPTLDEARENAKIPQLDAAEWLVIKTATVHFATGHSDLNPQARDTLYDVAKEMVRWRAQPGNEERELRVDIVGQASPRWRHPEGGQIPDGLNQKLSEERARNTKAALRPEVWAADNEVNVNGEAGPTLDLDDQRTAAVGTGTLTAQAEHADPDNDDQRYRIAVVTVWVRRAHP